MSAFDDYNHGDRAAERHQRAREITSGSRGADGLTAAEYALLVELRRQGIAITSGVLIDERQHRSYRHPRIVEMERSA